MTVFINFSFFENTNQVHKQRLKEVSNNWACQNRMVDGKVKTPKKRKDSKVEDAEARDDVKKKKKRKTEAKEPSEEKTKTVVPEEKEKKKKRKKAEIEIETKDETVEETLAQGEEEDTKKQKQTREKRKKKKSKEKEEKKENDEEQTTESMTKVDRAVQYLRLWSEHRSQWTFNKTLQTCLLQNAFNEQKVK